MISGSSTRVDTERTEIRKGREWRDKFRFLPVEEIAVIILEGGMAYKIKRFPENTRALAIPLTNIYAPCVSATKVSFLSLLQSY